MPKVITKRIITLTTGILNSMKEKIALLTEMSKEARRFLKSGERPISLKEKEEGVNIQSILDLETFETLLNEMLDTYRYEPSTLQSRKYMRGLAELILMGVFDYHCIIEDSSNITGKIHGMQPKAKKPQREQAEKLAVQIWETLPAMKVENLAYEVKSQLKLKEHHKTICRWIKPYRPN